LFYSYVPPPLPRGLPFPLSYARRLYVSPLSSLLSTFSTPLLSSIYPPPNPLPSLFSFLFFFSLLSSFFSLLSSLSFFSLLSSLSFLFLLPSVLSLSSSFHSLFPLSISSPLCYLLSALPSLFSHLSSIISLFSSLRYLFLFDCLLSPLPLPLVYFHSLFSPFFTVSSFFSPLLKGFLSLELTQTGAVRGWRRRYRRETGEVASLL
jgi:hypothetical protein